MSQVDSSTLDVSDSLALGNLSIERRKGIAKLKKDFSVAPASSLDAQERRYRGAIGSRLIVDQARSAVG
jgi:hypothetical protein